MSIVKQGQGHRAQSNAEFLDEFLKWLYALGYPPCTLVGKSQTDVFKNAQVTKGCGLARLREGEEDEKLEQL